MYSSPFLLAWLSSREGIKLLTSQYLLQYISCMDFRQKVTGKKMWTPTEKKKEDREKISRYDSCGSKWELILTCHPWNISPEKGCKVESHNHILDAAWLLESLRLNQDFGSSTLRRLGKPWRSESFLMKASWNASALSFQVFSGSLEAFCPHAPSCWARSQYVEVADTERAYWVWPDSYLPALPPGPLKLPGAMEESYGDPSDFDNSLLDQTWARSSGVPFLTRLQTWPVNFQSLWTVSTDVLSTLHTKRLTEMLEIVSKNSSGPCSWDDSSPLKILAWESSRLSKELTACSVGLWPPFSSIIC